MNIFDENLYNPMPITEFSTKLYPYILYMDIEISEQSTLKTDISTFVNDETIKPGDTLKAWNDGYMMKILIGEMAIIYEHETLVIYPKKDMKEVII
jgi:hypothetical protein